MIGRDQSGIDELTILGWASAAGCYRSFTDRLANDDELSFDAAQQAIDNYEAQVLRAPCLSSRVAAVQLRVGSLRSATCGERGDDLDIRSLEQVIAHLEAR